MPTPVRSPWLQIPLADYEAHMALPDVGQALALSDELRISLRQSRPQSLALAGCAGGNGLEVVAALAASTDPRDRSIRRIACIDINPHYVAAVGTRYAERVPGLELHVADLGVGVPQCPPVELVFAGLLLEYVELGAALATLRALCTAGGRVVVVSQSPDTTRPAVTPSPYRSLAVLAGHMTLRDPATLIANATVAGFHVDELRVRDLPGGKRFDVTTLRG